MRGNFAPWDDPSERPLISFDKVTKRFGGVTAVDALSLDIYAREFFATLDGWSVLTLFGWRLFISWYLLLRCWAYCCSSI